MIKIFKFQIIHICSNQAVVTRVFCSVLRMYWDGMMCSAIASDRYSSTFRDNEVKCSRVPITAYRMQGRRERQGLWQELTNIIPYFIDQ